MALRKARTLAEVGARVRVVAPDVDPAFEAIEGVEVIRREYRRCDVDGCALVIAATDDREINSAVAAEAGERGILVNVVDDPELCSFTVPAVVRRGDLVIAISTCGKSPGLSGRLRARLEEHFGEEYAAFVELLSEIRDEVKARYSSNADRRAAFERLLDGGILELLQQGRIEEAREKARACI